MKITTLGSTKALKWVRSKKRSLFPIEKLLTSKSTLQDSVYGSNGCGKRSARLSVIVIAPFPMQKKTNLGF